MAWTDDEETTTLEPIEGETNVGDEQECTDESETSSDAPDARLIAKKPADESEGVFEITVPCVVGRFDPATGPIGIDLGGLPDGSYVSRKHAQINWNGTSYTLTDLGSSNGTWHLQDGNWSRISEETELAGGDEIAFGQCQMIFDLD